MHTYSIDGSRAKVAGYIMLVAVIAANAINYGLTRFVGEIPFAQARVSVSVLIVFSVLLWLFDHYLWRWKGFSYFAGVPDVSGQWIGPLNSSFNGEETTNEDECGDPMRPKFTIHQTWSKIEVNADFLKSTSESTSASFITDKGRPQLVFTYRNYSRDSSSNRGPHEGTNTLRYMTDSDGEEILQGEYYTDQQRNNHGTMELRRPGNETKVDANLQSERIESTAINSP